MDGFIAREDGNVDWLSPGEDEGSEDYGFQEFFNSVDALVMGRNTHELALSFGSWPYGEKPVLIGSGIPLFGAPPHDIKLRHLETLQFTNSG